MARKIGKCLQKIINERNISKILENKSVGMFYFENYIGPKF